MEILKNRKERKRKEKWYRLIRLQQIDEQFYDSLKNIPYTNEEQIKHIENQKEENKKEWLDKINKILYIN